MKNCITVLFSFVIGTVSSTVFACTQEQAIDAMRAISQAQTELIRGTAAQQQRGARMAGEGAAVGQLLAASRFEEACEKYNAIAKKYGVDLKAYQAKLAPLGAGVPGECDTLIATRRVNESYKIFNDSVDTSGMSPIEKQTYHKRFSQSIDEATKYVQTDPKKACAIVSATLKNYGINTGTN